MDKRKCISLDNNVVAYEQILHFCKYSNLAWYDELGVAEVLRGGNLSENDELKVVVTISNLPK